MNRTLKLLSIAVTAAFLLYGVLILIRTRNRCVALTANGKTLHFLKLTRIASHFPNRQDVSYLYPTLLSTDEEIASEVRDRFRILVGEISSESIRVVSIHALRPLSPRLNYDTRVLYFQRTVDGSWAEFKWGLGSGVFPHGRASRAFKRCCDLPSNSRH